MRIVKAGELRMNKTKVEWVKNPDGSQGYSWNPITGCLNGCTYCYARKLANGRLRSRFLANTNLPSDSEPRKHLANPFYPRFWPERLKELQKTQSRTSDARKTRGVRLRRVKPKGIFVCNMCDFFGEWLPADWQMEVFKAIRANPQHRFYFLTKIPWNVGKWSPLPDNCWLGATVCDKRTSWHAFWYYFNSVIKAKIKFISFEPLLDDVTELPGGYGVSAIHKADWIVIGSQTKPYNPPKIEWVQALVEAADKAGKPVFLKDNLKPLMGDHLRQELPVG